MGRLLRPRRSLQLFQPADQYIIYASALVAVRLDCLENRPQPVQQLQEASNKLAVGGQFALAQQAKQIFSRVGQLLQPLETQESGGPLNCVNRTKDIPDQSCILGPFLQIGQTALHAVQPFLALDQKFPR